MNEAHTVHEEVAQSYTRAVSGEPAGACCAPGKPKGVLARMAGYHQGELASLPADVVSNSFGCGNPLAFSEVRPGQVVLDLGSGAGIDLLIAAGRVGPAGRVIGVDMTDAMIEKARANIAAAGLAHVEVRKGLIESLPVESASVDWVISNCVINLSPGKPRVFAEIARVLKPGGRMRVSDVMVRDLPTAVRDNKSLYGCCVAGAIGEEAYLSGLRAAGLVDVEIRERVVYDAGQLRALAGSSLPGKELDADLLASLAGKVCSAVVCARKPGG
jgi:SAM-dependent methyltransferase